MILNSDDSILYAGGGHLSTLQYDYFLGLYDSAGATAVGKALFDYGSLVRDIAYGMGIDSTGKIVLTGSNVTSVTSSTFGRDFRSNPLCRVALSMVVPLDWKLE